MQICIGCGAKAAKHPMVGVGRKNLEAGSGPMVDHPVCKDCHEKPEHRKSALKVTFFSAAQSPLAVAAARVMDEKSKAGQDLTVGT